MQDVHVLLCALNIFNARLRGVNNQLGCNPAKKTEIELLAQRELLTREVDATKAEYVRATKEHHDKCVEVASEKLRLLMPQLAAAVTACETDASLKTADALQSVRNQVQDQIMIRSVARANMIDAETA